MTGTHMLIEEAFTVTGKGVLVTGNPGGGSFHEGDRPWLHLDATHSACDKCPTEITPASA